MADIGLPKARLWVSAGLIAQGAAMDHNGLNSMIAFLVVAEERSFTKAAARLGLAQSTLSHTVKKLEGQLGIPLLNRTTRHVTPTEAGERLRQVLAPRIADIEAEIASLMASRDKPAGTIRMTLSAHALERHIWPKLQPILRNYPDLRVEFNVESALQNIVEEGFDCGVRLGEAVQKDMVAVRVSPDWRLVAVAAPDYFAAHAAPVHPTDLTTHCCINMRHTAGGDVYVWEFAKDNQTLRVRVDGQLTFSGSSSLLDAVLDGYGIAYVPEDMVVGHLEDGRLLQVLTDWSPTFDGYYLYYPGRRQHLAAFRVLVEALRYRGRPGLFLSDTMPISPA